MDMILEVNLLIVMDMISEVNLLIFTDMILEVNLLIVMDMILEVPYIKKQRQAISEDKDLRVSLE